MAKTIEFKIDIEGDEAKRLKEAREALTKVEKEIIKTYTDSARYKAALDLSCNNDYGSKVSPVTTIQHYKIVTKVSVDLSDDAPTANPRPTLYLAEKTVNMLLSGKLLTDEQKKALLKQVGLDLDALPSA